VTWGLEMAEWKCKGRKKTASRRIAAAKRRETRSLFITGEQNMMNLLSE
jgi:hypothetical protein